MPRKFLISVKPKYAAAIMQGVKTVELRKNIPIDRGDIVYIYETFPIKSIVGFFEVNKSEILDTNELWEATKKLSCMSHNEFKQYYIDKLNGQAIYIKKFTALKKMIKLETIKNYIPCFHPPQSYMYLSSGLEGIILQL